MKRWLIGLMLASAMVSATVHAEEAQKYDRVAFSANAEREVENDTAIAVLYAAEEGQDSTSLSAKVNSAITWGVAEAKKIDGVEARTLSYTTYPSYDDKGKIIGWQVRQTLQVKSTEINAMSTLLGKLQEQLRIESVNYAVSPKVQKAIEDELIAEALGNVKRRAAQVQSNMGRSEYRVVMLNIQSGQQVFMPRAPIAMMKAATMDAAPAPALEAGKQTLRVDVAAEIELSAK
ncbi:SIMPL domain-containing protein [Thiofilum flexile]|uniref:SIMPL domain-containing protein n=1 Tax=Thiofilum flexile TaxID=125627 RepID=UPI000371E102|nr:SIMPL domain-containing protein [Thiofilum flexile]